MSHVHLHITLRLQSPGLSVCVTRLAGDPGVVLCAAVPLAAPAITLMRGAPAPPPGTGPSKLPHVLQWDP